MFQSLRVTFRSLSGYFPPWATGWEPLA